jgi:glycosyltransferase involved in cell wall biosynthesis
MDSRIKVIHKENEGLFSAWNTGLDHMTGEYISFIDGDDFVSKDYIKKLLFICRKHHCDIASCSLAYGMDSDFNRVSDKENINVYDKTEAFMTRKIKAHLCGRLYKASLFMNVRARNVFYVDDDLTYKLFYKADYAAFTTEKLYYYYQSPNSMMRNDQHFMSTDFIEILEDRIHFFEDKEEELLELSWEHYCIALMLIYMKCRTDRFNRNNQEEMLSIFQLAYKRVIKNHITPLLYKLIFSIFYMAPNIFSKIIYGLHLRK